MGHSGRPRHRDRAETRRAVEEETPPPDRVFRITDAQRQEIAACLRAVDEARLALEGQHNAAHRGIVRELRGAADLIYDVLNSLEGIDG
jgi:hypothetical protein